MAPNIQKHQNTTTAFFICISSKSYVLLLPRQKRRIQIVKKTRCFCFGCLLIKTGFLKSSETLLRLPAKMSLQRILQPAMARLTIGGLLKSVGASTSTSTTTTTSFAGGRSTIHTTAVTHKSEDRRQMKASLPAKDEGTLGERTAHIDAVMFK